MTNLVWDTTLKNNFFVAGGVKVNKTANFGEHVNIKNNLNVVGNAFITGDVSISGSIINKLTFPTTLVTEGPYTVHSTDYTVLITFQFHVLSNGQEIQIKNITADQSVTLIGIGGKIIQ